VCTVQPPLPKAMYASHCLILVLCALCYVESKPAVGGSPGSGQPDLGCRYGRRFRQTMPIMPGMRECCVDAGGDEHAFGEKWKIGHLMYECNDGGYEITGCQARPDLILKPGEDYVENNVAHRCYRTHQGAHTVYSEYNCGLSPIQPSCDLKKQPINVDPVGFDKFEPAR